MSTTINDNTFDKIFIPQDLDNGVDPKRIMGWGKVIFFSVRMVPENYYLVRRNWFTQRVIKVQNRKGKDFGIRCFAPISRTILVPKNTGIIKFEKVVARTIEGADTGVDLTIDFSVSMKISDPAKYINEGKNQIKQFQSLMKSLLLNYVASIYYEEALNFRGNLDDFDPTNKLDEFSNRYGIKVEAVYFEKVELPKDLKDAQDEMTKALALQKAKEVENATKLAQAQTDAQVTIFKNNAHKEALISLVVELMAKGISQEQVMQVLTTYMISTQGNGININTAGGNSNSIVGELAAAIIAAQKANAGPPKNNQGLGLNKHL